MINPDSISKETGYQDLYLEQTSSVQHDGVPSIFLDQEPPPAVDHSDFVSNQLYKDSENIKANPLYTSKPITVQDIKNTLDQEKLLTDSDSVLKSICKNKFIFWGSLAIAAGSALTLSGIAAPLGLPIMGIGIALLAIGIAKQFYQVEHKVKMDQILKPPSDDFEEKKLADDLNELIKINVRDSADAKDQLPNMPFNFSRDIGRFGEFAVIPSEGAYKSPFEEKDTKLDIAAPLKNMKERLGEKGSWRIATLIDTSLLKTTYLSIYNKTQEEGLYPAQKRGVYLTLKIDEDKQLVTLTAKGLFVLIHTEAGAKQETWDKCVFGKKEITIPLDELNADDFDENPFPSMQVRETFEDHSRNTSLSKQKDLERLEDEFNLF